MDLTRAAAEALDAADPLAAFRARFAGAGEDGLLYLDGNSLGRMPVETPAALARVVEEEWARGLVRSWSSWVGAATRVGNLPAEGVLGARPGEVLVGDSTTVDLYKLLVAAADARPGRDVLVCSADDFPTDRYVVAGVAQARGMTVREVPADVDEGLDPAVLAAALDERVAVVVLSAVAYRSGALADVAAVTRTAREAGALVVWDLSHAAGAVPVDLAANGVDLAVGCTYKYLNGGPGAPAFLYVRRELQEQLRQPIWGWFGQRDQFAMGPAYDPVPGVERFAVGTPPVLALAAVEVGARLVAEAGVDRLAAKGRARRRSSTCGRTCRPRCASRSGAGSGSGTSSGWARRTTRWTASGGSAWGRRPCCRWPRSAPRWTWPRRRACRGSGRSRFGRASWSWSSPSGGWCRWGPGSRRRARPRAAAAT